MEAASPWNKGDETAMASLRKRSVLLSGHSTSLALEPEFWAALEAEAARRAIGVAALIGEVDEARAGRPLASACRVAALAWAGGG